jgi:SAM-dependent methyltransferase
MVELKNISSCPVCGNIKSFDFERVLNGHELVKCNTCSFVFADISPEITTNVNSTIDEEVDATYQENQTGIDKTWFRYFSEKITRKMPQQGKILDIGCGNGVLLSILKEMKWTVCGNDLSPWAGRYAERIGYELYTKHIEDLDFKNEFDCIVSTSTFEHVCHPYQHLAKIIEALKPGGSCCITIPNYNSLSIRLNLSKFDFNQPPFHVNYFTPKSIKQLFINLQKEFKFKYSIRVYGIPELYSFYVFFNRIISKFKSNKQKAVIISSSTVKKDIPPIESKLKSFICKTIVLVNYYVGGVCGIGDRIEFYIQKKE